MKYKNRSIYVVNFIEIQILPCCNNPAGGSGQRPDCMMLNPISFAEAFFVNLWEMVSFPLFIVTTRLIFLYKQEV